MTGMIQLGRRAMSASVGLNHPGTPPGKRTFAAPPLRDDGQCLAGSNVKVPLIHSDESVFGLRACTTDSATIGLAECLRFGEESASHIVLSGVLSHLRII